MGMCDGDVRTVLHEHLAVAPLAPWPAAVIIDELDLCGRVRVDVAVVSDTLAGFEIKAAADTLRRLPGQVATYSKVLDYCALVVADNHVDRATAVVPPWWGIMVARWDGSVVALEERSAAARNPNIQPEDLALLLWRDELLNALEDRGAARGYSRKPRKVLADRLAEVAAVDDIRGLVRDRLQNRAHWHRMNRPRRV